MKAPKRDGRHYSRPPKIISEDSQPLGVFSLERVTDAGVRREMAALMCIVKILWDGSDLTPAINGEHPEFSDLMQSMRESVDEFSDTLRSASSPKTPPTAESSISLTRRSINAIRVRGCAAQDMAVDVDPESGDA